MPGESPLLSTPPSPPLQVSILMPTYNCLPLTQACVASLLATLPEALSWELILIDDGSRDGTREWMSRLSDRRIRVLLNEVNLGYAATNNRAALAAQGDILALLNNDLVLTPGWLEPMLAVLRRQPRSIVGNVQYAIKTGEADHVGIQINAKGKPEHIRELTPFLPSQVPAVAVTGACLLVPRTLWLELGGFDEGFSNGGEDVDLCFRAEETGARCWVATHSQILHHVSSSPNRKLRDEANSARLTRKWREKLIREGVSAWVIQHLTRDLTAATAFEQPYESVHSLAHWAGLTRFAPTSAVRGVSTNLEIEISRWKQLGVY